MPRLVLLSDHNSHSANIAWTLHGCGVAFDAILVQTGSAAPLSAGAGPWAKSLPDALRRRLRFWRRQKWEYRPFKTRVTAGGAMNSATMIARLKKLAPDYLILGSGNILKPPVIETARCGVLNCHPGLLPWMRGSGVVGHALARGVPVGATLHFIDAGIDTGAVIERRLLPVSMPSTSLEELEIAAGRLAAQMMADCVVRLIENGEKPSATSQTVRFPIFKWPDEIGRLALNELALSGRAHELFEAWQGFSSGAPDWILPPDLLEAPLPLRD